MFLLLIIPLLASGFRVCHVHPNYLFKLHRQEGQYLYLHVAVLGLKCFFSSFVINLIYNSISNNVIIYGRELPDHIAILSGYLIETFNLSVQDGSHLAWYAWVSFVAVAVIPDLWRLASQLKLWRQGISYKAQKSYILEGILSHRPLESFLSTALAAMDVVMLSMDDRKVYVGVVASLGDPSECHGGTEDVVFRPIISGYRCKDHLKVTFTTHYSAVDQNLFIILKQENIISASHFDDAIYQRFQEDHAERDPRAKCCAPPAS
ncbi:hypothetical protein SAMN05216198_1049 [Halopseudomonas litoralis]|uniref:Uncharacterized protein n=1 Tax=Halopseudomonas litoralis TaxID=797277 RepID=A0A1H1NZB3_9GAMM|nr:hypothetical protein SAMN05216198_1049 [Halopseudomonas litoralis]